MAELFAVFAAVGFAIVFTVVALVSRFLLICQPNEMIVPSVMVRMSEGMPDRDKRHG